jgi:predicted nucleic acid-binding protein
MSVEAELSFVDTNVLVYCFEKSDSPKKHLARRLLNQFMDDDRLRVSTQVYTEDLNDGQEIPGVRISNPFTT